MDNLGYPKTRSPIVAGLLSLILPGLGQIYAKSVRRGLSLLIVAAGIGASYFRSDSAVMRFTFGLIYLFFLIPAVQDAHALVKGDPRAIGQSKGYIVMMLLATGPFALPLLWQSDKFSQNAKILWSVFVISIALLFFLTIYAIGKISHELLRF